MEGRPPSESTLVANARKGDLGAYAELVRMHQDTAFRIAYLILADNTNGVLYRVAA